MCRKAIHYFLMTIIAAAVLSLPGMNETLQAMPVIKRTIITNGLRVLASEDHSLPMVTICLLIDGGSKRDPAGQEGIAYLTARALRDGTALHTSKQLSDEIDSMGAEFSTSVTKDYILLEVQVMKKDMDRALSLLMEMLTKSTFPEEEIQRDIQEIHASIAAVNDHPMELAELKFADTLFLNPYGHPVKGTSDSVSALNRDKVLGFYQTFCRPNNASVAIVGDITPEEIETKITPAFMDWLQAQVPGEHFGVRYATGPKNVEVGRKTAQAQVILGHAGISRENPDYYSLVIMNYILGGGFGSRLFDAIRVQRGLAYAVESGFNAMKYAGDFQVVIQTKNESAREAASLAIEQIRKMQEDPVSDQELETAKKYLTGSFPLKFDTQEKVAILISLVEYYGLGMNYFELFPSLIESKTKEDIQRVARQYLHPDQCILVLVADFEKAGIGRGKE